MPSFTPLPFFVSWCPCYLQHYFSPVNSIDTRVKSLKCIPDCAMFPLRILNRNEHLYGPISHKTLYHVTSLVSLNTRALVIVFILNCRPGPFWGTISWCGSYPSCFNVWFIFLGTPSLSRSHLMLSAMSLALTSYTLPCLLLRLTASVEKDTKSSIRVNASVLSETLFRVGLQPGEGQNFPEEVQEFCFLSIRIEDLWHQNQTMILRGKASS